MSQNLQSKNSIYNRSLYKDLLSLKQLWPYIKIDRKYLLLALVLLPVISILQLYQPIILKTAIDEGVMKNSSIDLVNCTMIFLCLIIFEYFTRAVQSLSSNIAVQKMIARMRKAISHHLLNNSLSFHNRKLSGSLVTRVTSDFDNLSESLTQGTLQSLVEIVLIVGSFIGMLSLHPSLGLTAGLIIPISLAIVSWFSKKIKLHTYDARKHLAKSNAYALECLKGMATLKINCAERESARHFNNLNESFRHSQTRSVTLDAFLYSILDGLSTIIIGLILWLFLSRIGYDIGITAGLIIAFIRYLEQIITSLTSLGQTITMVQGGLTSLERIMLLFKDRETIRGGEVLNDNITSIKFKNVSFSYPIPQKSINNKLKFSLKNINFELKNKESLAIVGPSGSGKSTLLKILTKQLDKYKGHIWIGSQNLETIDPKNISSNFALVPQDIVLFRGSIAFNIGLGRKDVDFADIVKASKIVGIHHTIASLPEGYDTNIAVQGSNFSVGQQQLIIFARALARKPKLVILDEATSTLDSNSEIVVQQGIERIFAETSVILVAHRLSSIRNCDKIIVLNNGEIAEQGNHSLLIKNNGLYEKLYLSLSN